VSSTDVLLNIATAARLFHASDGTGFADLLSDGHRETWPLRSNIRIVDMSASNGLESRFGDIEIR
jgi:hypothetical protein